MVKNKINYLGESQTNKFMLDLDLKIIEFYRNLPLSYIWLFRKALGNYLYTKEKVTLLDMGCADGSSMVRFGIPKNFELTGVDLFKPYLEIAKKRGIYKKLIKADVRQFKSKIKYDIVVANHIVEHLDKRDGINFINKLERLSKGIVIISSPIGDLPQGDTDDNKYQIHRSVWTVEEMTKLGYKVSAQGLKLLWGNTNIVERYGVLSYLLFILSYIISPVLLIKPELGTYMICTKNIPS